ncbi:MAG TPA: hypothetical protein VF184_00685 [Phycisphaeraceae bacterium]
MHHKHVDDHGEGGADPGSGLLLREGDINLHALTVGGGYVWCGCSTSPSRLVSCRPDFSEYETTVLEGTGGLHDLVWDSGILWMVHASGHLSRLSTADRSVQTIELTSRSRQRPFAYTCHSEAEDLWIGMYTDPGSLLRVDKRSLAVTEYVLPKAPMWSVRDVAVCGGRVWACIYDVPGRIIGLDPETGRQTSLTLMHEHALPTTLVARDGHLWVGLDTIPARVLKIDPDVGVQKSIAFNPTTACVRALALSGSHLWIALHTEPAEVIVLDLLRESWRPILLPPQYSNSRAMACDGEAVFVGLQNRRHNPSAIYRLPLRRFERIAPDDVAPVRLTSQDWYRVRRGEDQLARGDLARLDGLASIVLSRRAGEEFCLLSDNERNAVVAFLQAFATNEQGNAVPIAESPCWLLARVGELRVILRHGANGITEISTIRKAPGIAFDPENTGWPKAVERVQWQ